MSRNIEIKAKVHDKAALIKLAEDLCGKKSVKLEQYDIFYNSPNGRLKLRSVTSNGVTKSELIWYDRPDVSGPKLSDYNKFDVPDELLENMKTTLSSSMGIKGSVKKIRDLLLYGQTRIHIDTVEGLGDFMELEVCLDENDTVEKGQQIASEIQSHLKVSEQDLLTGAYMDMLKEVK